MKAKRLNQELIKAVNQGRLSDVRRLLSQKANANVKDSMNHSVLYIALIRVEHKEIVELLLENGADPNTWIENAQSSILFTAIAACSIELMAFLNSHASNCSSKFASPQDRISLLLKYGADPYLSNKLGINAFQMTQDMGRPDLYDFLAKEMADIEEEALNLVAPALPETFSRPRARL